jgi:DUF971 family protein
MAHEPIHFGPSRRPSEAEVPVSASKAPPTAIDVDRPHGLTLTWADGSRTHLPVDLLRRHSPSAEARAWAEEQARNPLAVMPESAAFSEPLRIVDAELVGRYALRLRFSDGHDTGLYAWDYLRTLAPPDGRPREPDDAAAQPPENP